LEPKKRNSLGINDKIYIGTNKGYLILKIGHEIKESSVEWDKINSSFTMSSHENNRKPTPGDRYIFPNYDKIISKSKKNKNKKHRKSKTFSDCIKIIRKIKNQNEKSFN
jgi:hypothetical protein